MDDFLPRFLRLSLTASVSNMMIPLAGLVDIAFLGHLEDINHLAGVVLASIIFDYLYRVLKFIRTSTNAITANASSIKDAKAILVSLFRSAVVAILLGALILCVQYPLQKFAFFVLSGSTQVEHYGLDYFRGRVVAAPAVLLNFVLIGWFLGQEKSAYVLAMTFVGTLSNVFLDYWMIVEWHWASYGAGLATALSQYLTLIVGLVLGCLQIDWSYVVSALKECLNWEGIKATLILKTDIFVRFLILISVYAIFTNFSASMGTIVLSQNGLLIQIALLSQFTIQGFGLTTQTLVASFNTIGKTDRIFPILRISLLLAGGVALLYGGSTVAFPDTIFNLLSSHGEVNRSIAVFTWWLIPLLFITAVVFMLEGFLIGLKETAKLRNAVVTSFIIGFLPLACLSKYLANNHLLWLSLVLYMTVMAISMIIHVQQYGEKLTREFSSTSAV